MSLFFFKQKTAYEVRISDWSSDVCSSDLFGAVNAVLRECLSGVRCAVRPSAHDQGDHPNDSDGEHCERGTRAQQVADPEDPCEHQEIGRASCRESMRQYV